MREGLDGFVPRSEGPSCNSPARKGGDLTRELSQGRKDPWLIISRRRAMWAGYTSLCRTFGARKLNGAINHALTGVAITCRLFEPEKRLEIGAAPKFPIP